MPPTPSPCAAAMLPDLQEFASAVNLFLSDEHRLLKILGFSSAAVLLQSVCECWSVYRESKFADWRAWGFVCGVVGALSVYLLILLVQSRRHLLGGQLRACYAVLALWWVNGVATLTFTDPFCLAGNGYFGTWASFACSAKLVALNVPLSCRAPLIPKLIVLFASVVVFVQSCIIRNKGSDHVCTANGVRSSVMNHGVRKADQGPSGLFDYSISYGVVGACVCLIDIIADSLEFDTVSVLCLVFSCAWWLHAVAIATCYQPFHYAGNGYFSCWFAWLACLVSSWQAIGPTRRDRLSVFLQTLVSPLEKKPLELLVLILLSLAVVFMAIISCVETRSASDDRRGEVLVLILSISSAVVGAQLVAVWTSQLRARDFMVKLGTICLCLLCCVCSFVSLFLGPFRLFGNGFVVSATPLVAVGLLAHRLLLEFGHQAAVDRVKEFVSNNKELFSVYIASCFLSLQAVVDCLDRGYCDYGRGYALACGGGSVLLVASACVSKILGANNGFIASTFALAGLWLLGVAKFTFDKPYVYADVAYLSSWVASASSVFLVTKEWRDYLDSQLREVVRDFTANSLGVVSEDPAFKSEAESPPEELRDTHRVQPCLSQYSPFAPSAEPATRMPVWSLLGKPELGDEATSLTWVALSTTGVHVATPETSSSLYVFVKNLWDRSSGSPSLSHIELVDVPGAYRGFEAMMYQLGIGRANGVGNPLNPVNHSFPEYVSGLERLKQAFVASKGPDVPARANLLFTFHGTKHDMAHGVVLAGPRPLRSTDAGFFGAGSYTALEASYAARYSRMGGTGPDGRYVCILYAAVVGAAYVVTQRLDYSGQGGFSKFFSADPKHSVALLGQHDSHFIPVKNCGMPLDFQACAEADAEAHELVSQHFMQLCPIALIYWVD